jgi:hypothetical protein
MLKIFELSHVQIGHTIGLSKKKIEQKSIFTSVAMFIHTSSLPYSATAEYCIDAIYSILSVTLTFFFHSMAFRFALLQRS